MSGGLREKGRRRTGWDPGDTVRYGGEENPYNPLFNRRVTVSGGLDNRNDVEFKRE